VTAARAAVVRGKGQVALEDVEIEEPRPDEVLVKVLSSGICRTDLEVMEGVLPTPFPVVAGHEGAGIVEAVGSNVSTVAPGDTVVLGVAACGICKQCRAGSYAYCEVHVPMNFLGARLDGSTGLRDAQGKPLHGHFMSQSSWASHALSHVSNTIKVSSDLDPAVLGPFGCGIQTGAGSVMNVLDPEPGTSIAVFGLGAVGQAGIMAAQVSGLSTIVAVGLHEAQMDLARELGATHVVNSGEVDAVEAIRDLTGGGVQYSLEATGSPAVMRSAVDVLVETGHAAITGVAPGQTFELDVWNMLRGRTVHGTTLGDAVPAVLLPRLVELYQQGRFPVDKLMTHYPLGDIEKAIADVDAGRTVKAVLHP
jgi:aryl-alcohol dehydrogenase